jgi:uncharacterized protein with HEPN domain
MSKRNPTAALRHMLDHAKETVLLAQGKTRADLDTDRLLNLALVRLLEIVSEAAGRVPETVRAHHPEIPWPQIISLRNRLIHGYDSVDFNIYSVGAAVFPTCRPANARSARFRQMLFQHSSKRGWLMQDCQSQLK